MEKALGSFQLLSGRYRATFFFFLPFFSFEPSAGAKEYNLLPPLHCESCSIGKTNSSHTVLTISRSFSPAGSLALSQMVLNSWLDESGPLGLTSYLGKIYIFYCLYDGVTQAIRKMGKYC